jgi:hypothetical protein
MSDSSHFGDSIPPDDTKAIEDMAGYVIRNPMKARKSQRLEAAKTA